MISEKQNRIGNFKKQKKNKIFKIVTGIDKFILF